jgi:hypothetical protein
VPHWAQLACALLLIALSIRPIWRSLVRRWRQVRSWLGFSEAPRVSEEHEADGGESQAPCCSGPT